MKVMVIASMQRVTVDVIAADMPNGSTYRTAANVRPMTALDDQTEIGSIKKESMPKHEKRPLVEVMTTLSTESNAVPAKTELAGRPQSSGGSKTCGPVAVPFRKPWMNTCSVPCAGPPGARVFYVSTK